MASQKLLSNQLPRRDFLKATGFGAVSLMFAKKLSAVSAAKKKPNILILESDQHMAAAIGCYGNKLINTPNIDSLAKMGILFENAISPCPVCVPSRTSMISGRWPRQTGVIYNGYKPNRDIAKGWTFPKALQKAGYYTGLIGKTHISQTIKGDNDSAEFENGIKEYGFDSVTCTPGKVMVAAGTVSCKYSNYLKAKGVYKKFSDDMIARRIVKPIEKRKPRWYCHPSPLNEKDFHDAWISDQGAEWIDNCKGDKPFFLWLNWGGPHQPWDAPGKYATMYDPDKMELPLNDHRQGYPSGKYTSPAIDHGSERTKKIIANYYGLITLVDDGIGRIVDVLKKRGMLDNTIIIYNSDHGEMLGNHGFYAKEVMYEDSVRVPMIVSWPNGFVKNTRIKTPVSLMDLIPTILESADTEFDREYVQGTSLMPILKGQTTKHTGAAFSEIDIPGYSKKPEKIKMVQTERYKYIYSEQWQKRDTVDKALLFDLEKDPKELNNLSGHVDYVEIEKELRKRIQEWQKG
ncbi:MAG: sulfatase family protein [Planctomycetota bacterium]|jgi:arylsulfatase A-like enzyme